MLIQDPTPIDPYLKGDEGRHPNPVMDGLMKKIGATYDGKNG